MQPDPLLTEVKFKANSTRDELNQRFSHWHGKILHLHPQAGWHPITHLPFYLWHPLAIQNGTLNADELWCRANGSAVVWVQPGDINKIESTFPVRVLQKTMSPRLKISKLQSPQWLLALLIGYIVFMRHIRSCCRLPLTNIPGINKILVTLSNSDCSLWNSFSRQHSSS